MGLQTAGCVLPHRPPQHPALLLLQVLRLHHSAAAPAAVVCPRHEVHQDEPELHQDHLPALLPTDTCK